MEDAGKKPMEGSAQAGHKLELECFAGSLPGLILILTSPIFGRPHLIGLIFWRGHFLESYSLEEGEELIKKQVRELVEDVG